MKKDLNKIIVRPHITEKASISVDKGVYTFEVSKDSTKVLIEKAIQERYKVNPVKITTVTIPGKRVFVRGRVGKKSGYKKAYVYLKKGDKIETL